MKFHLIFLTVLGIGLCLADDQVVRDFKKKLDQDFGNGDSDSDIARDLDSDFNDFLNLIPQDELVFILFEYLDDFQVQQTITYMFSDEFRDIIAELDTIEEFSAVEKYLDNAGIPVTTFFDNLKEILGITRKIIQPTADLGGWKSMLSDMSEKIPWDEMKSLYDDKMENSKDFQKFIADLTSDEFKALVEAMVENPRMQEISAELTAGGVDIVGLYRLLKEFFGSLSTK